MTHPNRLLRAFPALVFSVVILSGRAAAQSPTPDNPPPAIAPTVAPAPAVEARNSTVENSVVKIFATTRGPDLTKPWTKLSPREVGGTGMVIEGKRILTNAHVVAYSSQVQVQANQSGDKLPATVEFVAPGIDLAVLKLD
ncbi:MAG: peptidase, partial [Lacunisphaera sp.]|nr:peptidase [Lacunisphaera sp.]